MYRFQLCFATTLPRFAYFAIGAHSQTGTPTDTQWEGPETTRSCHRTASAKRPLPQASQTLTRSLKAGPELRGSGRAVSMKHDVPEVTDDDRCAMGDLTPFYVTPLYAHSSVPRDPVALANPSAHATLSVAQPSNRTVGRCAPK